VTAALAIGVCASILVSSRAQSGEREDQTLQQVLKNTRDWTAANVANVAAWLGLH
jgi:hypothetical protein